MKRGADGSAPVCGLSTQALRRIDEWGYHEAPSRLFALAICLDLSLVAEMLVNELALDGAHWFQLDRPAFCDGCLNRLIGGCAQSPGPP